MKTRIIYCLSHDNEIFYVGKTTDLNRRLTQHRNQKNSPTRELFKEFGNEIKISKITECLYEQSNDVQKFYIAMFISMGHPLLNKSSGGFSAEGIKHNKISSMKQSFGRRATFMDSKGKVWKTHEEAAEYYGISPSMVSHCLTGKAVHVYSKRSNKWRERIMFKYVLPEAA